MIKILKNEKVKVSKKPYPKWMLHENKDLLVLFTRYEEGMSFSQTLGYRIGDFRKGWIMSDFKDHNEPVTSQNV